MSVEPPEPEPGGRLQPVSAAALAGWTVVGLLVGWVARPLSERWWGAAPVVTWLRCLRGPRRYVLLFHVGGGNGVNVIYGAAEPVSRRARARCDGR